MEGTTLTVTRKTQVVDESFNQGMVEHPLLLILLEEERFSYAILDRDRHKIVVLKDFHLPNTGNGNNSGFLDQVFEQDDLLSGIKADKVIFSIHTSCKALVPSPLFNKENAKDILNLTCRVKDHSMVYNDKLKLTDAHLLYAVPEILLKEIGNKFNEVLLFNASTSFIESQLMLNKHQEQPVVSVNVGSGNFDIVISKGSELIFNNTFPYETSEDFIYYLLFTFEQLQLNPDVTELRFYGDIDKTSANWIVSKKYIRNLSLGTWPEGITFSYEFERLHPHQYFNLFIQHLCAS